MRRRFFFVSTIFIPVSLYLPCKGYDVVIYGIVQCNAALCRLQPFRLDKQAHSAGKLALYRSWGRGNAALYAIRRQYILQRQTLLVIFKEDIVADIAVIH